MITQNDITKFKEQITELKRSLIQDNHQEKASPVLYASLTSIIGNLEYLHYTDMFKNLPVK